MKRPILTFPPILAILLFVPKSAFGSNDMVGTTKINEQIFKWTHTTSLPSNMTVSWIASDPNYITIEMKGPSKGYIAIGFSPTGGMTGADIFIGWVDPNGTAHLLDMFATYNGQPTLDMIQNLELIGGREDENGTAIVFRRRWDTCDDEDFPIGNDTMRLIYATSTEDPEPTRNKGYFPTYHGKGVLKRGVKSTFMKVLPQQKFPDEEDVYPRNVSHVDLTVKNIVVPKKETYYHCKIVKFPRMSTKHHIIAHRPLIAIESIPYVQHISIYKCHVPEVLGVAAGVVFEKYLNQSGGDCYTKDSPHEWAEYCSEYSASIAMGGEGDILPDHLGDAIGNTDEPTYYRVEVHYENPQGKLLNDSSGVRFFYTSVLRQYETAVLFTGHRRTPFLTIPPHQKEYKIYGFCGSECTQQGIQGGIKIYSVLLHAHLTGRRIILRHIRNGVELEPIAQDNHIDFNYQQYRVLQKEVIVLPGDELITECTYDTEDNDTFVYGGLSTRREKCESFIIYYPKSSLIDCRSQPEFYTYFSAIGVQNAEGKLLELIHQPFLSKELPENLQNTALVDDSVMLENGSVDAITHDLFREVLITRPKELEGFDVHDHMMNLNWDDKEFVKSVEEKRKSGLHYMHCSSTGGKKINTTVDAFPFPVYEPWKVPEKHCGLLESSSAGNMIASFFNVFLVVIINI